MTSAAAPTNLVAPVDELKVLYQALVLRTPKTRDLSITLKTNGDLTISSYMAPPERQPAARHAVQRRAADAAAQQDGDPPPGLRPTGAAQAPPPPRPPGLHPQQPASSPPTGLRAAPPPMGTDGAQLGFELNARAPIFQTHFALGT